MEINITINLPKNPGDFVTGTVFALPTATNFELWRVAAGRGGKAQFIRMTMKGGALKAGEARWMPTESCKVDARGRLVWDQITGVSK
jgi:hypothetical protein